MKKISILFSTLALAVVLHAQSLQKPASEVPFAIGNVTMDEVISSRQAGQEQLSKTRPARGDQFFCEDFSNGFDGNNPFGAWTIEDSGDNSIWMMATASSPAGEFSSNLDPLESPTADNGWVIFDCDLFNTPISDGYEDVTGWLYAPVLDCSALNSVIVEYYQYFRYCCFSTSPLTLEVSTNGGTDWTIFPGHGDFVQSTNTLSANPLLTVVDISCVASGEEEVQLRWGFNSAVATGYSHYFWGLDDICVYENPAVNDLEIVQVMNGDIFNIWEYRVTPIEQAIAEVDGGMVAGAIFRNIGSATQESTVVTWEILDSDGSTVLATIETDPFEYNSSPDALTCPNNLRDTLYVNTGWVPDGVGNYFVRATISSENADETEENNTLVHDIVYTDSPSVYGHDDENALDIEVGPRESEDNPGFFDQTGYACFYTFPNAASEAFGLSVQFGPSSEEPCEFVAGVFQVTDNLDNAEFITGGTFQVADGWATSGDPIFLPFDGEEEMLVGELYYAGILTEDETEEELTVLAQANSDNDNSTLVFQIGGDQLMHWFTSQTWTPAMRLILDNFVGVSEIEMGLDNFLISPNPASAMANFNFTLGENKVVAYEVRDMNGRLVTFANMGRYTAGTHQFSVDVSSWAAGQYTFSLVLDAEVRFSRQVSVVK